VEAAMTFQEIILNLQKFWSDQGCIVQNPYDIEKGAGTMNPATFLHAIGPEPWAVCYVEPSRRPADGRYGDNPNRLFQHHQFQVIVKPSPDNIQELYLQSLATLGIHAEDHDIRFVEDNWESPTLGAWGLGWEVWLDGMEVTQFTYFQQVGSIDCKPVSVEITYGLERLAMYIQGVENVYDLKWNENVTYGDVWHANEVEQSVAADFVRQRGDGVEQGSSVGFGGKSVAQTVEDVAEGAFGVGGADGMVILALFGVEID